MLIHATIREPNLADLKKAMKQRPLPRWPQDDDELLRLFGLFLENLLVDRDRDAKAAFGPSG